jgi:hypothetical protein
VAEQNPPLLALQHLSERHPALTPSLAGSYFEAARICLDRHHTSPQEFDAEDNGQQSSVWVEWIGTDARTQAAWANQDDATRDGAYALAIAATELLRGLVAVRRAETRTGADYYIALPGQNVEDLENCFRLEVSGTNSDTAEVSRRLRLKLEQARRGDSNLPAIAAIIGFRVKLIVLQTVDAAP